MSDDVIKGGVERGFTAGEFAERTARAQARLTDAGMAGMLLMSEADIRYFTGFHTLFWQSPTRPWFVFVPQSGKPVAIIPEIGAALMRQSWVEDIRTWSAPNPADDGISLLIDLLSPFAAASEIGEGQVIGLLKGHETHLRMPLGDFERLCAALPNLTFGDATDIVRALRMVKTPAEQEKLRHICAIGSDTFSALPEFVKEGMPLEDVFRAFRIEALSLGADDVPYLVGAAGQGGYLDVISPPSRAPLQKGDILMLDTGATWDGYFCDFDRNFAIGQADDDAKRAYDVLYAATEAGLAAARVGNDCAGLFCAMAEVTKTLDPSGGDIGRFGHGLGMQLTEQPSHACFDNTPLEAGMVLTLEPSLSYGDNHMMVHEENILITDKGAELLTKRAAPELPVI